MTKNNLIQQINTVYSKMTKTEKKVADFVLSNPKKALNITITELAKLCEVGETSVFRFCKTLNLKGYQDFRLSLALSTAELNTIKNTLDINVASASNSKETASQIMDSYISALSKAYEHLNYKDIPKVVKYILSAKSINLFGFGGSGTSAAEAKNKFMKILPNIIFTPDSHMQLTQAALLGEKDLAIIFSNSGITKDCIEIAKICHSSKVKVVFITSFPKTPALEFSDVLLLCGASEGPLDGGSIAAKTSQLFLVDILYNETFKNLGNIALENKKKTSKIITEKMM
mgnify:CR=1 FL=1